MLINNLLEELKKKYNLTDVVIEDIRKLTIVVVNAYLLDLKSEEDLPLQ